MSAPATSPPGHLADDVHRRLGPGQAAGDGGSDGDRRAEVPARDVAEGVHAGEDGEAEGQGDPEVTDADGDVTGVGGGDLDGREHRVPQPPSTSQKVPITRLR